MENRCLECGCIIGKGHQYCLYCDNESTKNFGISKEEDWIKIPVLKNEETDIGESCTY